MTTKTPDPVTAVEVTLESKPKPYYIICAADHIEGLVEQVNARKAEGYVPTGGMAPGRADFPGRYYQAMILEN